MFPRYIKPIEGLLDGWPIKIILVFLTYVYDLMLGLFSTNIELLILTILVIIGDFIVGISASRIRGEKLKSIKFRQTVIKGIEYTFFILIAIGVSNAIGSADVEGWVGSITNLFDDIDYLAFLFVIYTEVQSMVENSVNLNGIWERFKKIFKNKLDK